MLILSNSYSFVAPSQSALPQTPLEYYSDETLHGNYQYVTLKDIIDSLEIEAQDDDSFLKNTKRSKMLLFCKLAIKLVNRQASGDFISIEFDVPDDLVFTLPQDYVHYKKVSEARVSDNIIGYELFELDISNRTNIATGYLQDNNAKILFDANGAILTADTTNVYNKPFNSYLPTQSLNNLPKTAVNGEFVIDERRGKIIFESKFAGKHIVLQYVSDGLQANLTESEITVHKYLEETIRDFVYYKCIEGKRNVPMNEKQRALLRHKTTLHQAKLARMDFDFRAVKQSLSL